MAKLIISREDAAFGHFHAIVGFLNLIQYIYRYCLMANGDNNAGFGRDITVDMFSLFLMVLLNLSSFIFDKHVPTENKGDNVTIWKEYRLHNLIFIMQSSTLLSFKLYEVYQGQPLPNLQHAIIGLVAARFVAMATATHYNPPIHTTSIRGAYKTAPAWVRFMVSYAQFAATAIVLCWEISIAFHFTVISGSQFNSFLMTLRKKGKVGTFTYLSVYVGLIFSMVWWAFLPPFLEGPPITSPLDWRIKPFFMGLFTFWIRRQGVNRFLTWAIGPLSVEMAYRGLNQVL